MAEGGERIESRSLQGELAAGRIVLGELMAYFLREDLAPEVKLVVVPLINATIRTVTYVETHAGEEDFDWDEALDHLKEEWGGEI